MRRMLSCGVVASSLLMLAATLPWAQPPEPKEDKDRINSLGMKFVKLPKGTFYMGWDSEKKKATKTEIKEDFEIAIHTVTQDQWQTVMGKNPSWFSRDGLDKHSVKNIADADLKQFPVENVSWDDAQEFIKKLNERERGKGWTYRLPSEREWEYACRGGATSEEECSYDFYFAKPSNELSSTQANFNGNIPAGGAARGPYLGRPTKVGSYQPNKLGLYDMHGNVWQWCQDASGPDRVLRGGSWARDGAYCQAAYRFWFAPDFRTRYNGFRLARVPVNSLGMKFVKLPKGTFYMGWDSQTKKATKTEIKEDFEIAIHTVTQGQWQTVMGNNPSCCSRAGRSKDAVKDIADADLKQFPVENVSWDDVQEFIKKLNERERGKGWTYRLPSEREWEYACRGGATSEEECSYDFYFAKPSNALSSTQANFNGAFPAGGAAKGPWLKRPTKVGSYQPNKLGLYDMHGNVWQWCQDLFDASGPDRVLRGGCWSSIGSCCRAAFRIRYAPDYRFSGSGFRLARVPVGR